METHPIDFAVFQRLGRSKARLAGLRALGDGMAAAIWHNCHDAVHYAPPGHHTLSLYLSGGYGTFRRDQPDKPGAPGKLCLLSNEEDSDWIVNGSLQFLHLYIPPEVLAGHAVSLLDMEPRRLALPHSSFFDNPALTRLLAKLAQESRNDLDALVQGNALAHAALVELLSSHAGRQVRPIKGGLAPQVRRRVTEWLEHHLGQAVTLGEMARQANLSEFHFARMFRESFGMTAQDWVRQRRLAKARQLLTRSRLPLTEIALQCGYASSSHFSHRFKDALGLSPLRYRQVVLNSSIPVIETAH